MKRICMKVVGLAAIGSFMTISSGLMAADIVPDNQPDDVENSGTSSAVAIAKGHSVLNRVPGFIENFSNQFSGVLLIAQRGEIVHKAAYGQADRDNGIVNTPDTLFNASIMLQHFNAVAVLKLAEEGKLSLDDPLSKYFTDISEYQKTITLHHLLTQTTGLDRGEEAYEPFKLSNEAQFFTEFQKLDNRLEAPWYIGLKVDLTPGQRVLRLHQASVLLALVIERVSGMEYGQFMDSALFRPAGLENTSYGKLPSNGSALAVSYENDGARWGTLVEKFGDNGAPINSKGLFGLFSTVADLYKWHLALRGGNIISPSMLAKLDHPYFSVEDSGLPNLDIEFGYGMALSTTFNGKRTIKSFDIMRQQSLVPGSYADYVFVPEDDTVIIALGNHLKGKAKDLLFELERTISESDYIPRTITVDAE